jgi:hypothetical protein
MIGILFLQGITFAALSAIVADRKGRDALGWFALGLIFGLFGFLAALAVDELKLAESESRSLSGSDPEKEQEHFNAEDHEKKCPDCAEHIKLEAHVCRFCTYRFPPNTVQRQIKRSRQKFHKKRNSLSDEESSFSSSTPQATTQASNTFSAFNRLFPGGVHKAISGAIAIAMTLGIGIFFVTDSASGILSPLSPDEEVSQSSSKAPKADSGTSNPAPYSQPLEGVDLDSLLHATVVAEEDLRPIRIQRDSKLRRPYWIDQSQAVVFPFHTRIVLWGQLGKLRRLLIEGRPFPLEPVTDSRGRAIITRDEVRAFLDTVRTNAVDLEVKADTFQLRDGVL